MQISNILKVKGCILEPEELEILTEECKMYIREYCHTEPTDEMSFILADMIMALKQSQKEREEGVVTGLTQGDTSFSFAPQAAKGIADVLPMFNGRLNRFRKFAK